MKKSVWMVLCAAVVITGNSRMVFGHACDDPWRPNPSAISGPGTSGPGVPVAPPPPPPPPQAPPVGPVVPGVILQPGVQNPPNLPGNAQNASGQLPSTLGGGGAESDSPDNIVLIPEADKLKIVGKEGGFRTYIVNRSPRDLFDVRLAAISPAFDVAVNPESITRLVSGEKDFFDIKLKLKDNFKGGKFAMDFKVSSRGQLIYEGGLNSGVKEEPKENLAISLGAEPVKIAANGHFKIKVKNNIFNVVNNVKVEGNSNYFEIMAAPNNVKSLSPGSEAEFTVSLKLKKGIKPGKYDIRLHAVTSSRNVRTSRIISINAEK